MNVCVFGAGAVGGMIAARLAMNGVRVSVVARGETLGALKSRGLVLRHRGEESTSRVDATDVPAELGPQDLIVLAVKAPSVLNAVSSMAPPLGPNTTVLVALNGIPWWYFHQFESALRGLRLESVDPGRRIEAQLPTHRVLGCVVRFATSVPIPGVVQHAGGDELIIGEPNGSDSERLRAVGELLRKGRFDVVTSTSIQKDVWYKLWGNMTTNPVSAITGASSHQILDDPLVEQFCLQVMEEAARIGEIIGCPIAQTGRQRNEETRRVPSFKTSMLQDVEAGRSTEVDALLGAVVEIGRTLGIGTPSVDALLGLARLHSSVRGLYGQGAS